MLTGGSLSCTGSSFHEMLIARSKPSNTEKGRIATDIINANMNLGKVRQPSIMVAPLKSIPLNDAIEPSDSATDARSGSYSRCKKNTAVDDSIKVNSGQFTKLVKAIFSSNTC